MDEPLEEFDALVHRAVEGEIDALAQLLTGQQVWLAKFVSGRLDKRLASRVDVGDIVQEVLVEAARKLPDYLARSPIPFSAWLKQIALERMAHMQRVHIRSVKRSVLLEVSLSGAAGAPPGKPVTNQPRSRDRSPSSYVAAKEMCDEVTRLMEQLPECDRELLRMRFIEQMPTKQIATTLGITETAVRMRQLRALRQLRELLESASPEDDAA
jgi:RNA polymerase sigma-70 factor (ECF subfamily)